MPELTSSLSIAIAETSELTADTDMAVAETHSPEADLDMVVADYHSITAGTNMRIVDEFSRIAGLDLKVVAPWEYVKDLVDEYYSMFIRPTDEGDVVAGVLLGDPDIRLLHRVDESLEHCTGSEVTCVPCSQGNQCHVVVAINFFHIIDDVVRVLVCDEILARAIADFAERIDDETWPNNSLDRNVITITNNGRGKDDYRDTHYTVKKRSAGHPMAFWTMVQDAPRIDLSSISDQKIVGTMF